MPMPDHPVRDCSRPSRRGLNRSFRRVGSVPVAGVISGYWLLDVDAEQRNGTGRCWNWADRGIKLPLSILAAMRRAFPLPILEFRVF
jgi:hypothetical protein